VGCIIPSNLTYALGSSLGAAMGGIIADNLVWRWEFGVQIPIILMCLATAVKTIPEDIGRTAGKAGLRESLRGFDNIGSFLLEIITSLLVLSLVS
jgi:predicted MFS family arabinose efflux permease